MEWKLRKEIRGSFEAWCRFARAPLGQSPAAHHLLLIEALERLALRPGARLIVLMPPGSAKSTYVSTLFPAWWLAQFPRNNILAASHTSGLAEDFGRAVRALILEHGLRLGVRLHQEKHAAGQFLVKPGGSYYALGVHGAVTGRRADLGIIDDPIKGFQNSELLSRRDSLWNWFRSEWMTRLTPGARMVLVMTRWHSDDLAGRLISQGGFEVIQLPATAGEGDPIGRAPGEALWPENEGALQLAEKRCLLGERVFSALYQQCPLSPGGRIFDPQKIVIVDTVPPGAAVRAWDLASTASVDGDPDWTVGLRMVRDHAGVFYIDDIVRIRGAPVEVVGAISAAAQADGQVVTIGLPQDPGQAGKSQIMFLVNRLAGYCVQSGLETGSKATRAMPFCAQVASGNVVLRRAAWNSAFFEELALFPEGKHDDQIDAAVRAFSMLCANGAPARFAIGPGLGR